jgi:hypothetical protein
MFQVLPIWFSFVVILFLLGVFHCVVCDYHICYRLRNDHKHGMSERWIKVRLLERIDFARHWSERRRVELRNYWRWIEDDSAAIFWLQLSTDRRTLHQHQS